MKSRRELKALLLASVATLTLMSGCSKEETEHDYAYYFEVDGEYIEMENVKNMYTSKYGYTNIYLEDGTVIEAHDISYYKIDKNNEKEMEFVRKLNLK